ncbi:MAG: hypothetical protein D6726_07395 [Nitrospirae bacterium]|nr:MAG: hypothetical protein D6726_07395 [Nitrospirota bacterium]
MRHLLFGGLLVFSLLISVTLYASDEYAVQIGSYSALENAKSAASLVSDQSCFINKKGDIYRVDCGVYQNKASALLARDSLRKNGFKDAFVVALNDKPSAPKDVSPSREQPPVGSKPVKGSIFERTGGYFHPFLSLGVYYTDNVFNTPDNEKSDTMLVITPGIWVSLPRVKQKLLSIRTENISPGGLELSLFREKFPRRYQSYLLYKADIEQFKKYSSENTVSHRVEGLFQYNFRGGLSFDVIDQYNRSHDLRGTGLSGELDKYNSNLINLMLNYDVSEKFKLRGEYSNFFVDYNGDVNAFRDRVDNGLSGYIFYKFKPKTSVFFEYEFLNVNYDQDIVSDSKEHHFYGGIQWDITAKSKGRFKAGYGEKNFSGGGDANNLIFEVQIDHRFTPKTSLKLAATRKTNETTISATDYILTNAIQAEYLQRFTGKISGAIKLGYRNDKYNNEITFEGVTAEREDDIYDALIALQYEFKDYLKADAGYIYTRRDSNFSGFDYTNNTFFFRITGAL